MAPTLWFWVPRPTRPPAAAATKAIRCSNHLERLVDGEIVWAPAIEGGFVLTTRGGDFELAIGQDISIGYLGHSDHAVELYLQETFHLPPADHGGSRGAGGAATMNVVGRLAIR